MLRRIYSWLVCRRGATALEYGLIAGLIGLIIVALLFLVGEDVARIFSTATNTVESEMAG